MIKTDKEDLEYLKGLIVRVSAINGTIDIKDVDLWVELRDVADQVKEQQK